MSLELHHSAYQSTGRLLEAATRLDEKPRWFKRVEQCILELNAPGNDIFASNDVPYERNRIASAQSQLNEVLKTGGIREVDLRALQIRIDSMLAAARKIFDHFENMQKPGLSAEEQQRQLVSAARAMARMDEEQLAAFREVGIISDRTRAEQRNIFDEHEANYQAGMYRERYFIAASVVLLFGLLWFGYRLQKADVALEAERQRVKEEQQGRLAAVGELCSSVAHGIRNPLAAIRSSTELTLEMGRLDENSRSRLEDILSEGERLADRVTGLLGIAKVSAAGFKTLRLQEVVNSALREVEPEVRRKGLSLEQRSVGSTIAIRGDRLQLEQLVIELVSNAMEHSSSGQSIEVRCDRPVGNGTAEIIVQDSGEGVPKEAKARLFDLFYTTKPHGTGIGLATVKRIARLHGGDVVLADSSRGAKFVVSIPTVEEDPSAS